MTQPVQLTAPAPTGRNPKQAADLRSAADKLEAGFIAEMLKSAGFGKSRESFNGGAGEDGFSSFIVNLQAEQIVKAGGFGLSEHIFQALMRGAGDDAK